MIRVTLFHKDECTFQQFYCAVFSDNYEGYSFYHYAEYYLGMGLPFRTITNKEDFSMSVSYGGR